MRIFLLFFLLFSSINVYSEVKIGNVVPCNGTQCTGSIEVIARDLPLLGPFKIKLNGDVKKLDLNGIWILPDLCVGLNIIEVDGSIECAHWEFNVMITGCNSNIQAVADFKAECFKDNDQKNGFINLTVIGGTSPLAYSWFNEKNVLISNSKNIANLGPDKYTILIKDANNCTYKNTYIINRSYYPQISSNITAKCTNIRRCSLELKPMNQLYNYSWSDGLNQDANQTFARDFDLNQNTTFVVTVTDKVSKCQSTTTFSYNKSEFGLDVIDKQNPNNDPLYNNGSVKLYLSTGGFNSGIGTVQIFKDNNIFRTVNWNFDPRNGGNGRFISITNLSNGYYTFFVYDGSNCFVDDTYCDLFDCDGNPPPKIKITNYALPPVTIGSFAKATVEYEGDISKCFYKWWANDYYVVNTTAPELTNSDMKKLVNSSFDNGYLNVKMICPCGISEDRVSYNPCGYNNYDLTTKERNIEKLCFGVLPTGKTDNKKLIANIIVKIDLNQFSKGGIGVAKYDQRIVDFDWTGGLITTYENFNQATKILEIHSSATLAGKYFLCLTTSNGCRKCAPFEVINEWGIHKDYAGEFINCNWETWCGNEPSSFNWTNTLSDGHMEIIDLEQCKFEYKCGNGSSREIIGRKYENFEEHTYPNGQLQCNKKIFCDFSDFNNFTLSKPLENGFIELAGLNPPNFTFPKYAFSKIIPTNCCQQIESVTNLGNTWHKWLDYGGFDLSTASNPCKAKMKCTNGSYYILDGTVDSDVICKDFGSDACKRCFQCTYSTTIDGMIYSYTKPKECYLVTGSDCPNCMHGLYLDSLSSQMALDNFDCTLDNLSNELILNIVINSNFIKSSQFLDIQIYSVDGRLINQLKFRIQSQEEKITISVKDYLPGVYFVRSSLNSNISFTKRFTKIY